MSRPPRLRKALVRSAFLALLAMLILVPSNPAGAYIGPGAGFAFVGSLFVLIATFFLAAGTILIWPITFLWRTIRVGNPFKNAQVKRVVILGLDGFDPGITTRLMGEGRLPNFQKLAEQGVFRPLATTYPSMSPVAWSSFTTGVDPSRHCIYDFLTRDPCNYMPVLSSTDIGKAKRVLNIGKYVIPLSKPHIRLLQKSQAFWKLLGEHHIFSIIQRVPITFPPVPFKGLLLSAMCVPDLRGSQGTFSFFSTKSQEGPGRLHRRRADGASPQGKRDPLPHRRARQLPGEGRKPHDCAASTVTIADDEKSAPIEVDGCDPFRRERETYSEWVQLAFKAAPGAKVRGIARFYVRG